MNTLLKTALALAVVASVASPLLAQSILPQPEQPFRGKIGLRPADSEKDFPEGVKAPKGAPNILLI